MISNNEPRFIEDIVLYETQNVGMIVKDQSTGFNFSDLKYEKKSFRIFGTHLQIRNHLKGLPIDEVYLYKKLKEDRYWKEICFSDDTNTLPTLDEYNTKFEEKFNFYNEIYVARGKKTLIINNIG
jgi:hypothetical protein